MYHNSVNIRNSTELHTANGEAGKFCYMIFYHDAKLNNKLEITAKKITLYLKPWQQKPSKLKTGRKKIEKIVSASNVKMYSLNVMRREGDRIFKGKIIPKCFPNSAKTMNPHIQDPKTQHRKYQKI
jgi:hypothetical protein